MSGRIASNREPERHLSGHRGNLYHSAAAPQQRHIGGAETWDRKARFLWRLAQHSFQGPGRRAPNSNRFLRCPRGIGRRGHQHQVQQNTGGLAMDAADNTA